MNTRYNDLTKDKKRSQFTERITSVVTTDIRVMFTKATQVM